jgi:hypothetical protein
MFVKKSVFSVVILVLLSMDLYCGLGDENSGALQPLGVGTAKSETTSGEGQQVFFHQGPDRQVDEDYPLNENPLDDGAERFEAKADKLRDKMKARNCQTLCCAVPCTALECVCVPVVVGCGLAIGLIRWATCDCAGLCRKSN